MKSLQFWATFVAIIPWCTVYRLISEGVFDSPAIPQVMIGLLVFQVTGLVIQLSGLYNMWAKNRELKKQMRDMQL